MTTNLIHFVDIYDLKSLGFKRDEESLQFLIDDTLIVSLDENAAKEILKVLAREIKTDEL